jgi:hypothetical protein
LGGGSVTLAVLFKIRYLVVTNINFSVFLEYDLLASIATIELLSVAKWNRYRNPLRIFVLKLINNLNLIVAILSKSLNLL